MNQPQPNSYEDIINESPVDKDMIVPSPCGTDNEDWINPFVLFHDICYLSFRLKLEGMNFVADSFKFLSNIRYTNMIITKRNNMLACPKECLNKYRGILQLVHQDSPEIFKGSSLQMVFQAQNQPANSMQFFFHMIMTVYI